MRIICELHYLFLSLFLLIFACELLKRQFDYVLFLNKQNVNKLKRWMLLIMLALVSFYGCREQDEINHQMVKNDTFF